MIGGFAATLRGSFVRTLSHPSAIIRHMDLGPVIRILENVPATLPAERTLTPTPPQPAPAKEPTPA